MLTEQEMLAVAEKHMAFRSRDNMTLVVIDQLTERKPYGNIYTYDSKKFMETLNTKYQLLTGPFMVEKATGRVVSLGTARSLEFYLEQYKNGTLERSSNLYWYPDTEKFDSR